MARPIVALLTDFGTSDHYAGVMKGVILGICPEATLVDLTHDVPPHDVLAAALELGAGYRYFPTGTIFLAVVDPGVGSARRGLAVEAGGYRFAAPDNGVLTVVLHETPPAYVVDLTDARYARSPISRTFEGRDRFAPAAGWMAAGVPVTAFGGAVTDYARLDIPRPVPADDGIRGTVLRVDRFGNLVTNIRPDDIGMIGEPGALVVAVGDRVVPRLVGTYAELEAGEAGALFGSTDRLEVAVNGGSASARFGLGAGAPVAVKRR